MRNPLTNKVESSLGAVFIALLALFFIGLIFTAIKNAETDEDIMMMDISSVSNIKKISQSELAFIREWIKINNIEVPEGRGYNYLIRKYPNRPWMD